LKKALHPTRYKVIYLGMKAKYLFLKSAQNVMIEVKIYYIFKLGIRDNSRYNKLDTCIILKMALNKFLGNSESYVHFQHCFSCNSKIIGGHWKMSRN
jgi:hypothetical protein